MLRERSSDIASFMEHPSNSILKMYSVLILVFWFLFETVQPKFVCKTQIVLNLQVLREGSSDFASFLEHPVYSNLKLYRILFLVFLFYFASVNLKCVRKSLFYLKFQVLHEERNGITCLVEHPVCSDFKMYSGVILVLLF